jgi:hypothetical protein
VKVTTKHLLERYQSIQVQKDRERLENPIDDLTHAFVEELNRLSDTQVLSSSLQGKRHRRIILFFDTFEQLASVAAPWLLDYFLSANISNNVVLVVAGRDSIEHSTPDGPKPWLPYIDTRVIHSIQCKRSDRSPKSYSQDVRSNRKLHIEDHHNLPQAYESQFNLL